MATNTEPVASPHAHYVPVLENHQPSLPILSRSQSFSETDTPPTATNSNGQLQSPEPQYAALPAPIGNLIRSWLVLRWRLSRNIFSVPVPFLTTRFDFKLGDLILTTPLSLILIVVTALQAEDRDVSSSGTPPTIALLFVFAFAVRNNSVLLALTGISFERALLYHKIAAFVTVTLAALHGLAYLLARDHDEEADQSGRAFTGIVAFAAMVLLLIFSIGPIRRNFFEIFVRSHWILFIVAIVFAVIHGAALALVGIVPWLIDMLFRLVYRPRIYAKGSLLNKQKTSATEFPSNAVLTKRVGVIARDQLSVSALPGDIVRIQFPRVRKDTDEEFKYEAGQYAFLCVPAISGLQWHPFTISSSPHEPLVTFHIKALGDWTQKLKSISSAATVTPFDVLVDGPYGSVSIDIHSIDTYAHFALFSGGIGVTPMRSIVNWLHHKVKEGRTIQRVHFVWTVRSRDTIEALIDQDRESGEINPSYFPHELGANQGGVFSTELYLTRGEENVEGAWVDQQLGSCLRFNCRPDIAATLRSLGGEAKSSGKDRVAVLVCGPAAMVQEVTAMSMELYKQMKVKFDVHSELFEF
ncbi:Respiratory burst oxidase B [Phytophthora citrophthora]|uniref:Respiratory burst oxidase B n=1 Tax=Phytophthora citrophthora TaxID=4793 RepID=A0AAD9GRV5_9STRA|nr:Respiratory burst oxidase B [Phytophthora citrophthora]